ncbi:MAG: HD domain-containing protein [Acidobacteria bacterium]|nr:HD domain-containing protein [Acidobacteriota bacterium]
MAGTVGLARPRLLWTLLGALILVAVIPLVVSHYFLTGINRQSLETLESKYLTRSAVGIANDINNFTSGELDRLRTIAAGINATATTLPADADPFAHAASEGTISNYLGSGALALWLVNREGRGATAQPPDISDEALQAMNAGVRSAIAGEPYMGHFLYLQQVNRPAMVIAVPVTNTRGETIGAVVELADLSPIAARLEEEESAEATAFVVNAEGQVLMHSEPAVALRQPDLSGVGVVAEFTRQPMRLTRTYDREITGKTIEVLGTVAPVQTVDWGVVVERETSLAFTSVDSMKAATVNWVIGAALLASIVGVLFATSISKPIRALATRSKEIAAGNYSQRVDVKGSAEVADLGQSFNTMSAEIQKAVEGLKKAAHENHLLFINSVRMLAAAIDAKDTYTRGHSERVARYSLAIGRRMNLGQKELSDLRVGALLHDVGKIGIDDRILRKPGALTEEEFEVMKTHPKKGEFIMAGVPQLMDMIPGMKYHHERWEGGGYPEGLKGEDIPLQARIVSVADTFDAMTTNRPYQKAMALEYVLEKIRSFANTRFDPNVVEAFLGASEAGDIVPEDYDGIGAN